jgi:hypothetical protein
VNSSHRPKANLRLRWYNYSLSLQQLYRAIGQIPIMSHSLYLYISTKESESRDSIRDLLKNRGNRKKKLKELAPQILNKDVDIVSLSFTRGWHLDDPSTELFFPAFIGGRQT